MCVGYAFEAVKVSNFQENFVRNVLIALAMRPWFPLISETLSVRTSMCLALKCEIFLFSKKIWSELW